MVHAWQDFCFQRGGWERIRKHETKKMQKGELAGAHEDRKKLRSKRLLLLLRGPTSNPELEMTSRD